MDQEHFRVGSININNLDPYAGDGKDDNLLHDIKNHDLDIVLLQEIGINWSLVPRQFQWRERTKDHFEPGNFRTKLSFNTHDTSGSARLWGGTGVCSYGRLSHHSMGVGEDPTGLGRWTWARYRGKQGIVLRAVSIYMPSENTNGIISVPAQHKRYLQEHNDDREPRQAFRDDLAQELDKWLAEGDQIIIGGDINTDVRHSTIKTLFEDRNLRNAVHDIHPLSCAPPTYSRTQSSRIVDGIWCSPGLDVTYGGFLEPGHFTGDHSLIWIDITYSSALGHIPPIPQVPAARRLQLHNPKLVEKYLRKYESLIDDANLLQRQFALEDSTQYGTPLTQAQAREAEAIDVMRTKCMRKAEKHCRKLKMGMVDFSPEISSCLNQLAFWDIAIKRREFREHHKQSGTPCPRTISSRLWRRKKKKAKIEEPVGHLSLSEMRERRAEVKKQYKAHKLEHRSLRKKFIDTFSTKDRERIKRVEHQRRLGRCAKLVTGKLESKSVTRVEHRGREYITRAGVEEVLLEVNRAKTRASDDTMFMLEPMRTIFGYRGDTIATEQVLLGTFQAPPGTSEEGLLLLASLKRPQRTNRHVNPRLYISTEDHIRAFKKTKERTSAGMSKLHYGMFKAHIKRRHLAEMDASMRSIAYTTGFVYKRWTRGLDVQLLKRVALWLAEKLRTILLLEADFNMNNKALGADAMKMGEANGWFVRDNYGGRKDMQAVEVSLNAQLLFNSIWARRGRAVIMSNDAKGCYDRIAHTVVNLALRRLGIPKPALQSMLDTIQQMEHYIRTAFGDSQASYGNDREQPPQGVLQGNGAGPAGWFSISTLLIQILQDHGVGYSEWTLIKKRAIMIICLAFVDDTDLVHATTDSSKSTETLIQEAQRALSLWEGLIRATGGALAPEKSYWYLLDVQLRNGQWVLSTTVDDVYSLHLNNGHCVQRLPPPLAKKRWAFKFDQTALCKMKCHTSNNGWQNGVTVYEHANSQATKPGTV